MAIGAAIPAVFGRNPTENRLGSDRTPCPVEPWSFFDRIVVGNDQTSLASTVGRLRWRVDFRPAPVGNSRVIAPTRPRYRSRHRRRRPQFGRQPARVWLDVVPLTTTISAFSDRDSTGADPLRFTGSFVSSSASNDDEF